MSTPLHVAIDARYLTHGLVGGVHTYLANLVRALAELHAPVRYTLWGDRKAPCDLLPLPDGMDLRLLPWSGPQSSLVNDRRIGQTMRRDGADVLHFPANCGVAPPGVPAVLTLHDAINLLPLHEILRGHSHQPRVMLTMTYLHLASRRAVQRRPLVITVSEYSRREILRHSRLRPEDVRVVPSAAAAAFRLLPPSRTAPLRGTLGLRRHVVLADAIKNPECSIGAYRALPPAVRDTTSLVFFSRREPGQVVLAAERRGEVIVLRRPAQNELVALYNLANVFLFPSWYEGFGLPVLEAMACGTPVLVSDRGALPEVAGDAGIVHAADDHQAFAASLAALLTDDERRARLRQAAIERAARYSWRRTALETLAIYQEARDRISITGPSIADRRHDVASYQPGGTAT